MRTNDSATEGFAPGARLRTAAARFNGAVCIVLGLAVNRWTIGLLADDGTIGSSALNGAILTVQVTLVVIGIWFIRARPRRSTEIAIALGTVVATTVAADVVALTTGVFVPQEFHERHRSFYGFFQPDSVLGHRVAPNLTRYRLTWLDESMAMDYNTDAFGFRNVGRHYDSARVWFIGDSFAFGDWVERPETFYGLLEGMLGEPTISLGVSGYGLVQYGLVAERHLPSDGVDVVGICIFANDLQRQPSAERLRDAYSLAGWDRYEAVPLYHRLFSLKLAKAVTDLPLFAGAGPASTASTAEANNGVTLFAARGAASNYLADSLFVPAEQEVVRLIDRALAANATPIVYLLPSKESAYRSEYARHFDAAYLANEEEGFRRICALAADREVTCVDLTGTFRARGEREVLYFRADPHWNRAGHALAAEAMSPSIRDALRVSDERR